MSTARMVARLAAIGVALVTAAGPALACGPEPSIRVSEPFALAITLCGDGAPKLLRLDAGMPAHRHGMNYRPTLSAVGPGVWRAEGMMFHMPGVWEVRLEIEGGPAVRVKLTLR